jgi:hypothetical protein
MKGVKGLECINLLRRFPCHLIISRPPYKVLQLIPIHARIFHPLHLILLITLHFHWWRWSNHLSRERIFRDGI